MQFREMRPEELLGPLNKVEEKHAPKQLFIAGDAELCRNFPRVSVIGTRKISETGSLRTKSLVATLVSNNIVVVSGLARGVDACAHRSAIEAGGKTIAVLGTPLDKFYPRENEALQRQIMSEHLVISQFPQGFPVQPKNFAIRNRTMALISHATVIIEAGETSGTLHQGWEALRLGRPLFLLESLTKQGLTWPDKMIGYGAQVLTRGNIDMLLECLPQRLLDGHAAAVPF